ncbi:helix-turn-helix domain-containing protein [Fodinicola acaciae]|uniref:helix-turn-helix domain-containing protein n=1 Tax=Fodinicola acaciae TaxID=2681555 RepID=UPI0013D30557|nr:helix-turn-helix transcriptional regulator [Fodinicola acaciae]
MVLLRQLLGDTLRAQRLAQQRTLREVSDAARVSLGYLSEVERGQKEASSELLSSICEALGVPLSYVLRDVSDTMAVVENIPDGVPDTVPDAVEDGQVAGHTEVAPADRVATARITAPPRPDDVSCSNRVVVAA